MHIWLGSLAAFVLAWTGTWLVRRLAPRLGLVQQPVARSSHTHATPTGGGFAIIVAELAGAALVQPDPAIWTGLLIAAGLGLVGFVDDRRDLSPGLRLLAQLLALVTFGLMVMPPAPAPLPLILFAVAIGIGLWWINLFNFMDGIDGLAATQALFMLLAAMGLKMLWTGAPLEGEAVPLVLVAALAGFALWNWAPARIFMGDAGSLFVGMALFALGWLAIASGQFSFAEAVILTSLFTADATATLLVRLTQGQNIFAGHRSHAYQILSRRLGGHARASLVYLGLNIVLVLPAALLAHALPAQGPALCIGLLLVLGACVLALGAGRDNG